ncbi:MAG: RNA methyltransferase [Bacteroidota bacterium]
MKDIPVALLQQLQHVNGFDEISFINAHIQAAITSVRLHPVKQVHTFDKNEHIPWCAEGRYLIERPVFTLDPAFHAGAYYVQEASSMFLDHMFCNLIPERNGLRVLDLCAAPGGKSTLIASLLGSDSLLISNEVIRARASILEENMTKWGYMNNWVTSNDPRDFSKLAGYFDVVVIDAPCSGSGLFRKDEMAIYEWSENNVQLCSQRQQRILADVWPSLKEDGIVIYATCSYSEEEDEQILDWLAGQFKSVSLSVPIQSEWGIVEVRSQQHGFIGYRFFPHKVKGEGFFIAALKKLEGTNEISYQNSKTQHDKKAYEQSKYLIEITDTVCLKTENENYIAISQVHERDLQLISKSVYLRKTGVKLGMPTAKHWIPDHEVALSVNKSKELQTLHVNKEQALKFLKKEDMLVPSTGKGWYIVTYEGLGLGLIKSLGNRVNNYLPKHWRIRMEIN